ncbi:DUF5700 domain-containing putative Zn-dependent protease [Sporanaerobacter acetigenes]|uniref:DUF5700 domain-containing putative Zn-dependent protease n=1 Tax=Sporanaerobacter acetigenes TaxID=165813 RepID=UPI00332E7738
MEIFVDGVEYILNILEDDKFDDKKLKKYLSSKEGKLFLKHEKELRRKTNSLTIEEELRKVVEDENYKDPYEFYILKDNIEEVKKNLQFIKKNEDIIFENVLKQLYKYIPESIKVDPNIVLYAGGVDGGFAIFTKNVYINFIKYIGNIDEFEKILAHEFYHARQIPIGKKVSLILKMSFYSKKALYDTLGRLLEEGIASLVEHGTDFVRDDPVGTLTHREILFYKEHFNILNRALLSIKNGKPDYNLIYKINVYVLGYIISKTIYEREGTSILNKWTVDFDYKIPIKKYIEICEIEGKPSEFDIDVENWIMSM